MDRIVGTARRTLRSLDSRNFRLYFIGQLISMVGTWMQTTAQMWLVYRLTHSSWLLGVVGFAGQAPYLVFGLLGGLAADRFDRRRMLLWTQGSMLVQALLLAALTMTGAVRIWHVVALSAALGIANIFDMPGRQAFVVDLVDRPDLGNAIALNSFMFNASRLVGPAVAGLVVAAWGEGVAFLLNAASYLAVLAGLALMRFPEPSRDGSLPSVRDAWGEVRDGIRYAAGRPRMRDLILIAVAVSVAAVPYSVLMPIFADRILHRGADGLGLLMSASGIGALAGSILLARREEAAGLSREVCLSSIAFGAALIAFGYSRSMALSLCMMVVAGWGMMTSFVSCNTLLQLLTSNEMRGRVMSLFSMSFMGVAPIGSLAAGGLAERIGEPATVALGGVVAVAVGAWFLNAERTARAPEPFGVGAPLSYATVKVSDETP